MTHGRIAMQIKTAGLLQFLVHIPYPMRHDSQIRHRPFGYIQTVERLQEPEQIQIQILNFIQLINVGNIAPGIGKRLLLRLRIRQVYGFKKDIVSPLGVERGIDIYQIDALILNRFLQHLQIVAVV